MISIECTLLLLNNRKFKQTLEKKVQCATVGIAIERHLVYFIHKRHWLVYDFLIIKVISCANNSTVGVPRHGVQTSISLKSPAAGHIKERHFQGRALRRQNCYLFLVHQPNLWQLANDFLIRSLEEVSVHPVRVNTTWVLSISHWKNYCYFYKMDFDCTYLSLSHWPPQSAIILMWASVQKKGLIKLSRDVLLDIFTNSSVIAYTRLMVVPTGINQPWIYWFVWPISVHWVNIPVDSSDPYRTNSDL